MNGIAHFLANQNRRLFMKRKSTQVDQPPPKKSKLGYGIPKDVFPLIFPWFTDNEILSHFECLNKEISSLTNQYWIKKISENWPDIKLKQEFTNSLKQKSAKMIYFPLKHFFDEAKFALRFKKCPLCGADQMDSKFEYDERKYHHDGTIYCDGYFDDGEEITDVTNYISVFCKNCNLQNKFEVGNECGECHEIKKIGKVCSNCGEEFCIQCSEEIYGNKQGKKGKHELFLKGCFNKLQCKAQELCTNCCGEECSTCHKVMNCSNCLAKSQCSECGEGPVCNDINCAKRAVRIYPSCPKCVSEALCQYCWEEHDMIYHQNKDDE